MGGKKRREENQCTGRPTAPVITRYRCFLPDLAGLAGLRRVGPGTGTSLPLPNHPSPAAKSTPCANLDGIATVVLSKREAMNRRSFLAASAASLAAVAGKPIAAAAATRQSSPPSPQRVDDLNPPGIRTAGIRMVPVVGGKYKVWTKRLGSGPIKVLLLHGGPGFSHEYLEAMESFLPGAGIEMYYYDQLGCNNSDHPDDASLWTLPRYLNEVEEVRRGLGLDNFVLYGHSLESILAMEYALNHQQHLRALDISNMT